MSAVASPTAPVRPEATSARAVMLSFLLIGLLIGVRIVATFGALPAGEQARVGIHAFSDDAERYHQIAQAHGVPYRDSAVEFPPVALGFIEVVNGPTVGDTMGRLGWASLLLDLVAAGALAYGWGKRGILAYLALGLPFFYLPFVYFRVDLLSVALAAWGCALVKRRHDTGGGALLAVAVFAKLWPLALLPLLVVERKWKALATAIGIGTIGAIGWFAVAGTNGFEQVLTFRHAKGWQVESVTGGIIRAFTGEQPHLESGASRFGEAPFWATSLLAVAMVAVVAFIWIGVARRPRRESITYAAAPIAAVCAFMIFSPLLSPQYLIWLLPFAAVAMATGERILAFLVLLSFAATMMLTQAYQALADNELVGHLALNGRNALLVGIAVYATFLVWRKPESAASPRESSGDVGQGLRGGLKPSGNGGIDDELVDHLALSE